MVWTNNLYVIMHDRPYKPNRPPACLNVLIRRQALRVRRFTCRVWDPSESANGTDDWCKNNGTTGRPSVWRKPNAKQYNYQRNSKNLTMIESRCRRDLSGRTGEPITNRPDTRRTPPPDFCDSLPPCAIQASNLLLKPSSSLAKFNTIQ